MLRQDTSKRTSETEIMDDFDLQGYELQRTLKDLENINAWLGGDKVTINGIEKLLQNSPKDRKTKTVKIADIGCGNGAMLRKVTRWGRRKGYSFELIGIDANNHTIEIAKELSEDYNNIDFKNQNIFSDGFQDMDFDIILCTLTLHHFRDNQIVSLLNQFCSQSQIGVVINDLHRSNSAYILFKAFCSVFVNNEIARKDGLTSILRGFKRSDLLKYQDQVPGNSHFINWKWAFRYQWIIKKHN